MDFFSAQDHARRNTGRLVLFFLLAVLSLIVMTNILVMAVFGYLRPGPYQAGGLPPFDWQLFFLVGVGVIVLIAGGTFYKIAALSGGGDAVAAMLGAEPIFADDDDFDHRKVINVVEEMAIASGVPVPQVYLLKESGINAFAAGFSTSDAVITVTEGAIRQLNREQLQGVIAHEFSHILNGDMRLNIRLVGILYGILLIGLAGYQILRGSAGSGSRRGGGGVFLGLGLIVIGFAGTFFGKLIKAAVSRQREFLADASAIQFTRNPQGIGEALLRIGANPNGSLLHNPKSAELSHAFFSQGIEVTFASLFATHPPLAERIKRILPDWDGKFPTVSPEAPMEPAPTVAAPAKPAMAAGLTGAAFMAHIGRPNDRHLSRARELLNGLPETLEKAARDPFAARALLVFLILDRDEKVREEQLQELKKVADRGVYAETLKLLREVREVKPEQRLPLVELALPTLRRLTDSQYDHFLETLRLLSQTDGRISLFEWCLYRIVGHHLDTVFGKPAGPGHPITDLGQVGGDCVVLLSMLVHVSSQTGPAAQAAFAAARQELGQPELELAPRERLGLAELDRALKVLKRLKPQPKERLLKACAACVVADGLIEAAEAELLRAMAATLEVPMPPLVVDKPRADI